VHVGGQLSCRLVHVTFEPPPATLIRLVGVETREPVDIQAAVGTMSLQATAIT
jgi:hypothetical protein